MNSNKPYKFFLLVGALTGWLAVVLQFVLIIVNRKADIPETIIRFFSFFTILTNIIVSVCYTSLLLRPGKFLSRPGVITAVAVYITVVGLVYNVILRYIWDPQGLQFIVDELLHTFNPVWFILFWFIYKSKTSIKWKDVILFLIYPLVYILYVFARGAISGFYPYPFINVSELGYETAILNAFYITLVFIFFSLVFIGIGKIRSR